MWLLVTYWCRVFHYNRNKQISIYLFSMLVNLQEVPLPATTKQNLFQIMVQIMSKKQAPLPRRPEPPSVEQIIKDIDSSSSNDVVFSSLNEELHRKYSYYRHLLPIYWSEVWTRIPDNPVNTAKHCPFDQLMNLLPDCCWDIHVSRRWSLKNDYT